ncbi:nucleotide exchange factor GrpE [Streptomyces sp. NBC_01190]|uniref:nucleotide exchange factor GrpE n=1 Tax=Streptomyces sp. NBC_01190 TaxID=2903767 RepID=UPI00386F42C3|nr:nucleotide exchange factor GrpE [Streptomyces sp. NBC_01190]
MSDQEQAHRPAGHSATERPPPEPAQPAAPEPEAREAGEGARTPEDTRPDPPEEQAARIAELEDKWRRALADLDNLRKRYARELPRELEAERARVASAWLPVVDNLDLALEHADADSGAVASGVKAVRDQAVEVLRSLGYPRHEETGVPFHPEEHEVVSVVDDPDTAPGTVVQVLRPGYGEPGRQLRPAAVAVSRKQE